MSVMFQIVLQFGEGYNLGQTRFDTHVFWHRVSGAWRWQCAALPIGGERHPQVRYLLRTPIEGFPLRCFFGYHQCGQLAGDSPDLGEMPLLQVGARNVEPPGPTQRAGSRLCGWTALGDVIVQSEYDACSYGAERLTSLLSRFQSYLRSIAQRFQKFQPRFQSFGSPIARP
jgi:hypothetical protein